MSLNKLPSPDIPSPCNDERSKCQILGCLQGRASCPFLSIGLFRGPCQAAFSAGKSCFPWEEVRGYPCPLSAMPHRLTSNETIANVRGPSRRFTGEPQGCRYLNLCPIPTARFRSPTSKVRILHGLCAMICACARIAGAVFASFCQRNSASTHPPQHLQSVSNTHSPQRRLVRFSFSLMLEDQAPGASLRVEVAARRV